jgi:glycosyltransferase involved in cell wall biosynthesis
MVATPLVPADVSPPRVLHVMPNLTRRFGGPVEAMIGFVAAGERDVASTVVGPTCPSEDLRWLLAQLPPGTDVVTAGAGLIPAIARLAGAADIVHVHGLLNPVSSAAAWIARARSRPVVIDPFGTLSRYTFAHRRRVLKRLWFLAIDGPSVRRAHAMHFTTEAERDEAAWHGIDFAGRAHVVPPPWRAAPPPSGAHTNETVLFLSRLDPKKGVDVLLDAWPRVRAARPGAALMIAGTGDRRFVTSLESRATAGVSFIGFVTGADKAACLASAAVFVLPSHHENFGIAVLEAIAAGVPVVISPDVQLAPWVERQGVGVVVRRDPAELARALIAVLGDLPLRSRVARCGADAVVDDFGLGRVAPALSAMYHDVLGRHAHSGH